MRLSPTSSDAPANRLLAALSPAEGRAGCGRHQWPPRDMVVCPNPLAYGRGVLLRAATTTAVRYYASPARSLLPLQGAPIGWVVPGA